MGEEGSTAGVKDKEIHVNYASARGPAVEGNYNNKIHGIINAFCAFSGPGRSPVHPPIMPKKPTKKTNKMQYF